LFKRAVKVKKYVTFKILKIFIINKKTFIGLNLSILYIYLFIYLSILYIDILMQDVPF